MKFFLISVLVLVSGVASQQHTGNAWVTRAWDCCKPACGWRSIAGSHVNAPVKGCARDGQGWVGENEMSGCQGGNSYTCNNNQPWVGQNNVAYGFANAAFLGKNTEQTCCSCYELTFTSAPVNGQKMIVQVTNTGHNYGKGWRDEMEILFPGGGVGEYNACPRQWNSPPDGWGLRFGGITSRKQCGNLPWQLQPGCHWRYDWFKGADNPQANFRRVKCPKELTERSGCVRNDDPRN